MTRDLARLPALSLHPGCLACRSCTRWPCTSASTRCSSAAAAVFTNKSCAMALVDSLLSRRLWSRFTSFSKAALSALRRSRPHGWTVLPRTRTPWPASDMDDADAHDSGGRTPSTRAVPRQLSTHSPEALGLRSGVRARHTARRARDAAEPRAQRAGSLRRVVELSYQSYQSHPWGKRHCVPAPVQWV